MRLEAHINSEYNVISKNHAASYLWNLLYSFQISNSSA